MSSGHRRQLAEEFVSGGRCTGRAACRHFELHCSTFACEAKQPDAWLACLKAALRRVSNQHREMSYSKITRLPKDKGWRVGTRMVQRLRENSVWLFRPRSRRSAVEEPPPGCRLKRHNGATSGLGTSFTIPRCAVGRIRHLDLVGVIRYSQWRKQVRAVAEVVLAVCAQWLKALLLPAFYAQFLDQSQSPVAATIEGLIFKMFVNWSVR